MLLTFNLGITGKAATTGCEFFNASRASLGARYVDDFVIDKDADTYPLGP